MSVPPLVCSTPPPPDQCDDEADDDEISFSYKDSSLSPSDLPTDHFNQDTYTNFNYPLPERCSPVRIEIKSTHIRANHDIDVISNDVSDKVVENNNVNGNNDEKHIHSEEDNNIEDLNLRLESLELDFQNGKESTEDNLNDDDFDDFGTFLGNQILNDLSSDSFYLPKIDTETCATSTKRDTSEESSESSSSTSKAVNNDDNDQNCDTTKSNITDAMTIMTQLCNDDVKDCETIQNTFETDNLDTFNACDDSNNILWTTESICFVDSSTENTIIAEDSIPNICIDEKVIKSDSDGDDVSFVEYNDPPQILFNTEENENYNDVIFRNSQILDNRNDSSNSQLEIENPPITNIDDDFDDFAAFQSTENQDVLDITNDKNETEFPIDFTESSFEPNFEAFTEPISNLNTETVNDDEDDFGEFDTYVPAESNVETCNYEAGNFYNFNNSENLPMANETDVIEKLCSAIGNIFADDVTNDDDNPKEEQLELNMKLGESWRHLVNYDAQQSYLFPWNNSASQKTLLKCLGIDSRNILFGPKWNVNMPRFAANLGVSPLQPIRQSPQANDQFSDMKSNIGDMQTATNSSKDNDWESGVEYCGADFQTSSYAESLLLDLEHLMATLDQMTSGQSVHFKISDLFTNACNERDDHPKSEICNMEAPVNAEKLPHPSLLNIGRKINLPDTHIFTPTDSETPWSHTIHYDDDNLSDNTKTNQIKSFTESNVISDKNNIDDFDDFQSFDNNKTESFLDVDKVFKQIELAASNNTNSLDDYFVKPMSSEQIDDFGDFQSAEIESSNRAQFTEFNVLEPVRVTPITPVVNWPAPGEINASIFDDIPDVKQPNLEETPMEFMNVRQSSFILKESKIETTSEVLYPEPTDSKINDDFSDFQSMRPSQSYELNIPQPNFVPNPTPMYSFGKSPLEPVAARQNNDVPKNTAQQILQPLSLENYSQINWPDPGIDLQDLTRFNPVNSIKSYSEAKDSPSKVSNSSNKERIADDDGWSDFVSNKLPNSQFANNKPVMPNMLSCNGYNVSKSATNTQFEDNDDWSEFVSSSAPPRNVSELNTISQNIHSKKTTNYSHKSAPTIRPVVPNAAMPNINVLPHLSYVSTKSNNNNNKNYNGHFQNL